VFATVGSSNMDGRRFAMNHEPNTVVRGAGFAQRWL
jgi:phosphatidylserine/phosphatidylglycerophosphate/cardiolipin synthase-like enzyme